MYEIDRYKLGIQLATNESFLLSLYLFKNFVSDLLGFRTDGVSTKLNNNNFSRISSHPFIHLLQHFSDRSTVSSAVACPRTMLPSSRVHKTRVDIKVPNAIIKLFGDTLSLASIPATYCGKTQSYLCVIVKDPIKACTRIVRSGKGSLVDSQITELSHSVAYQTLSWVCKNCKSNYQGKLNRSSAIHRFSMKDAGVQSLSPRPWQRIINPPDNNSFVRLVFTYCLTLAQKINVGKAEIILRWFKCYNKELFMTCAYQVIIKKKEKQKCTSTLS